MIAKKKFAAVFTVFMFLMSLAIINVPVKSQSEPTVFYVDQPLGYIEAKPAGTTFWVDILVNASGLPFYHPDGIVGWGFLVKVDPTVLKPVAVNGATAGYFLYDYATLTGINYSSKVSILSTIDNVTGVVDVTEMIVPTPGYGAATDDPYGLMPAPQLLVSIQFESLTLYSDTTINITNPEYMDANNVWHPVVDGDGFYQGLEQVPVGADLVGRKGWAEHHRFRLSKDGDESIADSHGSPGVMTFYAKIKNVGDLPLTVRALFRMSKGGVPEPMVVSNEALLEPGDVVIVQGNARAFTEGDIGKWTLDVFCEYYFAGVWNLGETVKATTFVVVA
ncbi:hypothetical protein DRO69_03495 [Candidatus Bathyarchaeota archaeon]|nr:MAG: hypothetical protein DRO69_03495 [Candidatus Bathyarchaeota archaeon]